jgi:hypothetical protein
MLLPGVAGSDAHALGELWSVFTEIKASLEIDAILNAIKKGLVKITSASRSIHF